MAGALGVNAVRLADTALRNHCGFIAMLRMPGISASGNDADQLGLGTPQFQDASLGPAVWRKVGVDTALLVGASVVSVLVGSSRFASAEAMFEAAAGVLCEEIFYTIKNSEPITSGGVPCGYRLSVQAPVRA